MPRRLCSVVVMVMIARALTACEAVTEFFVGSWDPEDPPKEPWVTITRPAQSTDTNLTTSTLVEIAAGGLDGSQRFIAVQAFGAALSTEGETIVCRPMDRDLTVLPFTLQPNQETYQVFATLLSRRDRAESTSVAEACKLDASDDASSATPSEARTSACISAELRELCSGADFVQATAHATFGIRIVDAGQQTDSGSDAGTADASDAGSDASDAATTDAGVNDAAEGG